MARACEMRCRARHDVAYAGAETGFGVNGCELYPAEQLFDQRYKEADDVVNSFRARHLSYMINSAVNAD